LGLELPMTFEAIAVVRPCVLALSATGAVAARSPGSACSAQRLHHEITDQAADDDAKGRALEWGRAVGAGIAVVTGAAGLSALCAGAVAPETGAIGRRGLVGVVHAGGSGRVAVLAIFPRRAQYDDVWFHFRRLVKVGVWFVGTRGDGVLRLLLEIDNP